MADGGAQATSSRPGTCNGRALRSPRVAPVVQAAVRGTARWQRGARSVNMWTGQQPQAGTQAGLQDDRCKHTLSAPRPASAPIVTPVTLPQPPKSSSSSRGSAARCATPASVSRLQAARGEGRKGASGQARGQGGPGGKRQGKCLERRRVRPPRAGVVFFSSPCRPHPAPARGTCNIRYLRPCGPACVPGHPTGALPHPRA